MTVRSTALLLVLLLVPFSTFAQSKGKVAGNIDALEAPAAPQGRQRVAVRDLRISTAQMRTRVIVDLGGKAQYSEHRISGPDRLYVDIAGAVLLRDFSPAQPPGGTLVRTVRIGQHDADTVRLVLELGEIGESKLSWLDDRLVVDIFPPPGKEKPRDDVFTVVVDPGHGGEDPGAIGPGGIREKDVVLDVAKRLRDRLLERKGVRVVLTRDSDVFIPLFERTKIAKRENADLFVSVHVNAVPGPRKTDVRGIETYLLNWTNTKEAETVASRENRILVRAGEQNPDPSFLEMIFSDLSREYKRDESLRLAHLVQNSIVGELRRNYSEVRNLGVKQGRFFVLVGATMPAVLAEISFITHPAEGRLLTKASYRDSLAEGLSRGVLSYIQPDALARRYP